MRTSENRTTEIRRNHGPGVLSYSQLCFQSIIVLDSCLSLSSHNDESLIHDTYLIHLFKHKTKKTKPLLGHLIKECAQFLSDLFIILVRDMKKLYPFLIRELSQFMFVLRGG